MDINTQADYDRLRDYLCDMILEEQLKLGYERETIRFYSPCTSVGHILGLKKCDCRMVLQALESFGRYAADTLGEVEISRCSGERICFMIPAKGAEYVHEHGNEKPFLKELISCFSKHGITLQEVQAVFTKYADSARCVHIGSDEFDEVFFFDDGIPDKYRYCVKFDAGHASYHRFLKEDFEELLAEERGADTDENNDKGQVCDSYSL